MLSILFVPKYDNKPKKKKTKKLYSKHLRIKTQEYTRLTTLKQKQTG